MTFESSDNHDKRQEKENDNGDGIANMMPTLFSIIDRESEFPDYVRPRMRSRITKFTVYDSHKDNQSMDDDNDNDDDGNANDDDDDDDDDGGDDGNDDVVSDEDYFAAVEALRLIIVEIGDHTRFSPLLLHLIRTRLNEFEAEFLSGTYSDVNQWTLFKLDSSVDTEEQLKTVVHFFPKVLSNGRRISTMDQTMLPINAAALRKEAVPFVPVLAELGRKYNKFKDHQRGGLLRKYTRDRWNGTKRNTALDDLVRGTYPYDDKDDEERFDAIQRLRSMGLLKKEDVQHYNLLRFCCDQLEEKRSRIFEYLVNWNPEALLKSEGWDNGLLPHLVGTSSTHNRNEEFDQDVFITTMQLGLIYFPNEFGFMFHIDQQSGMTPFKYLCDTYNLREQFSQLCFRLFREPEDSITKYPWKKKEAFMMLATNDKVHLDGLYSMLRQDPNLLQHLLGGFD